VVVVVVVVVVVAAVVPRDSETSAKSCTARQLRSRPKTDTVRTHTVWFVWPGPKRPPFSAAVARRAPRAEPRGGGCRWPVKSYGTTPDVRQVNATPRRYCFFIIVPGSHPYRGRSSLSSRTGLDPYQVGHSLRFTIENRTPRKNTKYRTRLGPVQGCSNP